MSFHGTSWSWLLLLRWVFTASSTWGPPDLLARQRSQVVYNFSSQAVFGLSTSIWWYKNLFHLCCNDCLFHWHVKCWFQLLLADCCLVRYLWLYQRRYSGHRLWFQRKEWLRFVTRWLNCSKILESTTEVKKLSSIICFTASDFAALVDCSCNQLTIKFDFLTMCFSLQMVWMVYRSRSQYVSTIRCSTLILDKIEEAFLCAFLRWNYYTVYQRLFDFIAIIQLLISVCCCQFFIS